MATIAVLGTLDTKGHELAFIAERIRQRGHQTLLIDVGTLLPPQVTPDISRETVAAAASVDLTSLMARADRGECVSAMANAVPKLVEQLHRQGRIDAVIAVGGGGGTAIATSAMRVLPIGFPKLMVSTLASGNTAPYLGTKDIAMMPSIVDVAGLNRISKTIFSRAAGAICGMVEATAETSDDRPIIVASMFGNTTACVNTAIPILSDAGYEVLVFHATGTGGCAMESLIESGLVSGVLDITTTEWADELVGGTLSAGPTRLEAAGRAGVPAIVVPGCLDMVNFGPRESVPGKFKDRKFYIHNPQVTLMRTTVDECRELGRILASKLNAYTAPVSVLIPRKGLSIISTASQPFYDPIADSTLFDSLIAHLNQNILVEQFDCHINEPSFATACAQALLANVSKNRITNPY